MIYFIIFLVYDNCTNICLNVSKTYTIIKCCIFFLAQLDDWVLCRIYKKNSSAEKAFSERPKTEPSHNSSSSSSSQFEDVRDSFPDTIPAMDDKYLSFQNNKTTFTEDEDQKVDMGTNYDWASIAAFGLQDPTSNNANGSIKQYKLDEINHTK